MDWLRTHGRKVHLDFHTPRSVGGIGTRFDPQAFADILANARVNVLTAFTACHFGLSYYPSRFGERHPGLDFDLFGAILDAAHARGIKVLAYHGVTEVHEIGLRHPEWLQVDSKGGRLGRRPGEKYFCFCCLNSPYVEELLWREVAEFVAGYPVDGVWLDWVDFCADTCYCPACLSLMRARGVDPADRDAHRNFNEESLLRFVQRTTAMIRRVKPDLPVFYNTDIRPGIGRYAPHMDFYEVEFPLSWGAIEQPLYVRYLRTLGRPVNGQTIAFRTWGDLGTLAPVPQLQYECATMLANGATCCIGDHLHPDGRLDAELYERVGAAYRFVEEREPWCLGAQSVTDLCVLIGQATDTLKGAVQALLESHAQFDLLDTDHKFEAYPLVLAPDLPDLPPDLAGRLAAYVRGGGRLIAAWGARGNSSGGPAGWSRSWTELFGVEPIGETAAAETGYMLAADPAVAQGIPRGPVVVHQPFLRVRPCSAAARTLAWLVDPLATINEYFKHQAPPARAHAGIPAAVLHPCGAGTAILVTGDVFGEYRDSGNPVIRRLADNLLRILAPERAVETDAAPCVEVTLMRQERRVVVHLVNFHANRGRMENSYTSKRGRNDVIEEIPVRRDIRLSVRCPFAPTAVYLAPCRTPLAWESAGGRVAVRVPELHIHRMLVIEAAEAHGVDEGRAGTRP